MLQVTEQVLLKDDEDAIRGALEDVERQRTTAEMLQV